MPKEAYRPAVLRTALPNLERREDDSAATNSDDEELLERASTPSNECVASSAEREQRERELGLSGTPNKRLCDTNVCVCVCLRARARANWGSHVCSHQGPCWSNALQHGTVP